MVLISLSLIGIIFIQVSWLRNAVDMRKEQYRQKVNQTVDAIRAELLNKKNQLGPENANGAGTPGMLQNNLLSPFFPSRNSITLTLNSDQIRKVIDHNMKVNGLHVPYEYAIGKEFGSEIFYLLYSPGYTTAIRDTTHNLVSYIPLIQDAFIPGVLGNSEYLFLTVPADPHTFILHSMGWIFVGALFFTVIIIAAFALTVYTMLRQKKLSEIKSDFINNMTHEFKTPLATISLAVDAISNEKVLDNREKIKYFSSIIKEENKRMHQQVETILNSALLEREEIKLNLQTVDMHDLIQRCADNLKLHLDDKQAVLDLHLDAQDPFLEVDQVHMTNVISNLLDNALKYSSEHPRIVIQTIHRKKALLVSIQDNGIGMSKETLARIFEKFYRAHTGNIHNVKGFGLGLAYVKAILDAHGAQIRVESTLGKGSRFELEFPQTR